MGHKKEANLANLEDGSEEEIVLHDLALASEQGQPRDGIVREVRISFESSARRTEGSLSHHAESFEPSW